MKHFAKNLALNGFSLREVDKEYWIFVGDSDDIPVEKFIELCVLVLRVDDQKSICVPRYGVNAYNDSLLKCIDICKESFPEYKFVTRSRAKILVDMADRYYAILASMGVQAKQIQRHTIVPVKFWRLRHIMWMCQMSRSFVMDKKLDKAALWLGFVQGVLWSHEVRSVEQLRADNVE